MTLEQFLNSLPAPSRAKATKTTITHRGSNRREDQLHFAWLGTTEMRMVEKRAADANLSAVVGSMSGSLIVSDTHN